jgi:hypothetical protein
MSYPIFQEVLTGWRKRYSNMVRSFANSVHRAYIVNPCAELYWYYRESVGKEWGEFSFDVNNPTERRGQPWRLATSRPLPNNLTLGQLIRWMFDIADELPIVGGED